MTTEQVDSSSAQEGGSEHVERLAGIPPPWRAAVLMGTRRQSRHARTLVFRVPGWQHHLPGHRVDVRLTSADGYTAERTYSIAEPYVRDRVSITVDFHPRGEVSPYLVETMALGDELDVRGPLDAPLVWDPDSHDADEPLLLLGDGAGVVPLMTMLRARAQIASGAPLLLVYSTPDPYSLMYRPELTNRVEGVETRVVYTRAAPPDSHRVAGPIRHEDLQEPAGWRDRPPARVYVSGSDSFVDHAALLVSERGHQDSHVRIERIGFNGDGRGVGDDQG